MLLKMGVDVSKLEFHCRRALNNVVSVWSVMEFGEPVVTSTYEGTHSAGSLHYQNRAFDLRKPSAMRKEFTTEHNKEAVKGLKDELGKDFDIILEKDHIHVEYDPK